MKTARLPCGRMGRARKTNFCDFPSKFRTELTDLGGHIKLGLGVRSRRLDGFRIPACPLLGYLRRQLVCRCWIGVVRHMFPFEACWMDPQPKRKL